MISIDFGEITFENNCVVIQKYNSEEKSNARNISVTYIEEEKLFSIKATVNKKIFVCSREEEGQFDVVICQLEEDQEVEATFIESLNNEVLSLIQYSENDLYIDARRNQYTGEKDYFLFLRKGSYKLKQLSEQKYWTSNILIKE